MVTCGAGLPHSAQNGDMNRIHVLVRGVVQGVGYRYSAALAAEERGVSGWIRNRADGTVEASIEGEPEGVEQMLQWLRHGPEGARVDEVEVAQRHPEGASGFGVRASA